MMSELPVSQRLMQLKDNFFFFRCEIPSLDIRLQIVNPPQSATLPTS